jgi:two-component system NtrC family sensor kinase
MLRVLRTVSFRVFAGTLVLLLVALGLYATFTIGYTTRLMMAQARQSATRISDLIESSTRYSMLLNRKEDVYQIIRTIGTEEGVDGIRIYNKRGVITYSTDTRETGKVVDLHAEACTACHESAKPLEALPMQERSRIYAGPQGHRVLGVINPIRNQPACAVCHTAPAERTLLGVLDVRMSLAQVDRAIARARDRAVRVTAIAFLLVAIAAGLFLHFTVRRPIRALAEGTRQVAAGNLEHDIHVRPHDDLGDLASSFNTMIRSLRAAQDENDRWARTLEARVEEKTEELRNVGRQMLQIEKMASLGRLAATVAHEINNPLAGILTYARLQARRIERDGANVDLAQMSHDLDLIVQETQRCGGIVNNLLLFSRKQVGEFERVSLREALDRSLALISHHLKVSNVAYEHSGDADAGVLGDANQIQQAIVALCVNAAEAMPSGGVLRTTIADAGPGKPITLAIADTGAGIAPEDLQHIFEPFFTTKSDGKGVGLGLSVVYGIMERHGGSVSVESKLGKGTTFTLVFPRPDAASGARAPRSSNLPTNAPTPEGRSSP